MTQMLIAVFSREETIVGKEEHADKMCIEGLKRKGSCTAATALTGFCHELGSHWIGVATTDIQRSYFMWIIENVFVYFRLFIITTSFPSEQRPQKMVSCYGG